MKDQSIYCLILDYCNAKPNANVNWNTHILFAFVFLLLSSARIFTNGFCTFDHAYEQHLIAVELKWYRPRLDASRARKRALKNLVINLWGSYFSRVCQLHTLKLHCGEIKLVHICCFDIGATALYGRLDTFIIQICVAMTGIFYANLFSFSCVYLFIIFSFVALLILRKGGSFNLNVQDGVALRVLIRCLTWMNSIIICRIYFFLYQKYFMTQLSLTEILLHQLPSGSFILLDVSLFEFRIDLCTR